MTTTVIISLMKKMKSSFLKTHTICLEMMKTLRMMNLKIYKDRRTYIYQMSENKRRKVLFERIGYLSKTEHEEIFKILKSNNITSYSKNRNGVFFNLSNISVDVLEEIEAFVEYCHNNKKYLDDYEQKINECKINNNYTNIVSAPPEFVVLGKQEDDWSAVLQDSKNETKIQSFIERMASDRDRIGKKKVNIRFNNAKKRYSKKIQSDTRYEILQELDYEKTST